jgi:hypothetical protein
MLNATPALLLGALFCLGYGALAHLGGGRTLRDLLGFLLIGTIGFIVGQAVGVLNRSPFWLIGELHLFEASILAWLFLGVAMMLRRR